MTEELREKLARLRAVAPRLNAATDEAAKVVRAVEDFLAEVAIGVSASTRPRCLDRGLSGDGTPIKTEIALGYGRVAGKFQVYVERSVINLDDDGRELDIASSESAPWSSCDREAKLESVEQLSELLGALIDRSESLSAKAERATEVVAGLMSSLEATEAVEGPRPPSGGGNPTFVHAMAEVANRRADKNKIMRPADVVPRRTDLLRPPADRPEWDGRGDC